MAAPTMQKQPRSTTRRPTSYTVGSDRRTQASTAVRDYTVSRTRSVPPYRGTYASSPAPKQPTQRPAIKPVEKKAVYTSKKGALRTMCYVGIVFVMCCLMIYRYALILESNDQITKLGSTLSEAEYHNQSLQAKIDRGLELGALEEYATEKLGMIRPDQTQIFYIDVQLSDTAEGESAENLALSGVPGALVHAIRVLK